MSSNIYTVGGAIGQDGSAIYVERLADDQLLQLCLDSEPSYILTTRQIGKTSLRVRTALMLQEHGIRTISFDLNQLGTTPSVEQWYFGFIEEVAEIVGLEYETIETWWKAHSELPVSTRLIKFITDILLIHVDERIVIFIDEIDTTLNLEYTDDFFAAIRTVMNDRESFPGSERLTFVLIGSALPTDLIDDQSRTPFNIGSPVILQDFTFAEAIPLTKGFALDDEKAKEMLSWIMEWTNGHPYLTQLLCAKSSELTHDIGRNPPVREDIDRMVNEHFLEKQKENANLRWVATQISAPNVPEREGMLKLYNKVLRGVLVKNDERSVVQSRLKLSGIVKVDNGYLIVRNRIYEETFNQAWVREKFGEASVFATTPPEILLKWTRRIAVFASVMFIALAVSLLLALVEVGASENEARAEADRNLSMSFLFSVPEAVQNNDPVAGMQIALEALGRILDPDLTDSSDDQNTRLYSRVLQLYNPLYSPAVRQILDVDQYVTAPGNAEQVEWSPSGSLAVLYSNSLVMVWKKNAETSLWERPVRNEIAENDQAQDIIVNDDFVLNRTTTTNGTNPGRIITYDVELGGNRHELSNLSNVLDFGFSTNGDNLAIVADGAVVRYELETNEIMDHQFTSPDRSFVRVFWTPDQDCTAVVIQHEGGEPSADYSLGFINWRSDNQDDRLKLANLSLGGDFLSFTNRGKGEQRVALISENDTLLVGPFKDCSIIEQGMVSLAVTDKIENLGWSYDGSQLAVSTADNNVTIFEFRIDDTNRGSFQLAIKDLIDFAWHPSEPLLATIRENSKRVAIWETVHGAVEKMMPPEHMDEASAGPPAARAIAVGKENQVFVVDTQGTYVEWITSAGGEANCLALPNAETDCLVSTSQQADCGIDEVITKLTVSSVIYSGYNNHLLAIGTNCGRILVWETGSDAEPISIQVQNEQKNTGLAWNNDDQPRLATTWEGDSTTPIVIDITEDAHFHHFLNVGSGPSSGFTSVVFSPDNRYVAATSAARDVFIWDIGTVRSVDDVANCIGRWTSTNSDVNDMTWFRSDVLDTDSIDTRDWLAIATENENLLAVNADEIITGNCGMPDDILNSKTYSTGLSSVNAVEWVPGTELIPERLLAANPDGSISVFNVATQTLLYTMSEHARGVIDLAWTPGRIVSTSEDGVVIVWHDRNLAQLAHWIESERAHELCNNDPDDNQQVARSRYEITGCDNGRDPGVTLPTLTPEPAANLDPVTRTTIPATLSSETREG